MRTGSLPGTADHGTIRDAAAALAAVDGDAALAAELLSTLTAALPAELEDLRAALVEEDWPGLADFAHQVRGATRYCGVPALDGAIGALERAARVGDAERCQQDFAQVEQEIARLLATLDTGA